MSYGMAGNKIPKGYQQGRLQQYTPDQLTLFKQLFSHLGPESYTSRLAGGDEDVFSQIEAPAQRQFSGQLGNLASRFSGMGMGARKSSSFQNAATSAASNFSQELASRRHELQRQALSDLFGMSNTLLGQKPYENFLVEKRQKQGMDWGGLLSGGLGAAGGFLASGGNPMAASAGWGAGNQLYNSFS